MFIGSNFVRYPAKWPSCGLSGVLKEPRPNITYPYYRLSYKTSAYQSYHFLSARSSRSLSWAAPSRFYSNQNEQKKEEDSKSNQSGSNYNSSSSSQQNQKNSKKTIRGNDNSTAALILSVLSASLALFNIYFYGELLVECTNNFFLGLKSQNWLPAPGLVERNTIHKKHLVSGRAVFTPEVQYSYEINGKMYSGTTIHYT
jgi:hypothetical protein